MSPNPTQNAQIATALDDLLYACAELARSGCTVKLARTDPQMGRPVVEIEPPPRSAQLDGEFKCKTPTSTTLEAEVQGCRVRWTQPTGDAQ